MDIVEPERNFPQFPIRLDVNIEISIRFFPPPHKDRGDFSLFSSSFFAFFISIRIRLSSVNHLSNQTLSIDLFVHLSRCRRTVDTVGAWSDLCFRNPRLWLLFHAFRSSPFFTFDRKGKDRSERTKFNKDGDTRSIVQSGTYTYYFLYPVVNQAPFNRMENIRQRENQRHRKIDFVVLECSLLLYSFVPISSKR